MGDSQISTERGRCKLYWERERMSARELATATMVVGQGQRKDSFGSQLNICLYQDLRGVFVIINVLFCCNYDCCRKI